MTVNQLVTKLQQLPEDIKNREIFSMEIPAGTWNYAVDKMDDDRVKFTAYIRTGEITDNKFSLYANLKDDITRNY